MAEFSYNGMNFFYVSTRDYRTEDLREPSGIDQKYLETTLTLWLIITPQNYGGGSLPPAQSNEEPAETLARIREYLMVPRAALTYAANGKTLINITTPPDPMNGPFPLYCRPVVEHGLGPNAWVLEFSIKCAIIDCAVGQRRPFLTMRWSQSMDLDERGYATITTTGRATVNPAALGGASPDQLRNDAFMPLLPTFERKAKYIVSETGLEFLFTFVDTEVKFDPPKTPFLKVQVVSCEGKFNLSTQQGGIFVGTVTVDLTHKKYTPKYDAVALALYIAAERLFDAGLFRDEKGQYVFAMAIDDSFRDDTVRVMLRSKLNNPKQPGQGIKAIFDNLIYRFGTPSSAIGDSPLNVGVYGMSSLFLIASALGDPCLGKLVAPDVGVWGLQGPTTVGAITRNIQPAQVAIVKSIPNLKQPDLGWDKGIGVWDLCHVEISYDGDEGRIQLPFTTPVTGATCAVISLNSPIMTKTFAWTSEKINSQPAIPEFKSLDPNLIPLRRRYTPAMVEQMEDNSLKYTITGVYIYAVLDPVKARCAYPTPPWLPFTLADIGNVMAFPNVVKMGDIDVASIGAGSNFPPSA